MPIQGLQFTILSSHEAHQSYQATGSFIVYNPNDGVAYVATDRTASSQSFDYKVPSQSGGRFPGPINSYLSIYYLDQSGSGISGQVIVYATPEHTAIPYFWSIGRALTAQQTSMDITEGSQPPNPPIAVDRIWADSNGLIHHLHSNGVDTILTDPLQTGVVTGPMLAANAAISNLQVGDISRVIATLNQLGDQFSNIGMAATDNVISGGGTAITGVVPDTNDIIYININAMGAVQNPNVATWSGWVLYIDGAMWRVGPMNYCQINTQTGVPWNASILLAGPGTLAGPLASGSHNFELRWRSTSAITSGAYCLPASVPLLYRIMLEPWVLRR